VRQIRLLLIIFYYIKFEIYTLTREPDINSDKPKKNKDNGDIELKPIQVSTLLGLIKA